MWFGFLVVVWLICLVAVLAACFWFGLAVCVRFFWVAAVSWWLFSSLVVLGCFPGGLHCE